LQPRRKRVRECLQRNAVPMIAQRGEGIPNRDVNVAQRRTS